MSDTRSRDYPDIHSHDKDGPTPELSPRPVRASKAIMSALFFAIGTISAVIAVGTAYLFFFAG